MASFICLGIGMLMGMAISMVGFVILMEPRKPKRPPTKDEWKLM